MKTLILIGVGMTSSGIAKVFEVYNLEKKLIKMEQENKNTFYKNVGEVGQKESVIDLSTYFKIVDERKLLWIKRGLPQRVISKVNYLAFKYLV